MDVIDVHNEAHAIVELFEGVLDRYGMTVPSPEDDEREPDNMARLYGSVYYGLLDAVENAIGDILKRQSDGAKVVTHPFEISSQEEV